MPEVSLYLPEDIQHRVAEAARAHGVSETDYMRDAITRALSGEFVGERPRPRLPLFDSGSPSLARDVDEVLAEGFGRDGLG
ncbi:ribbon-helix-helix domain-containing protein [Nonomuraea glycinis]|uniref:ribbon-helix-helix domain-containing protein n=1 Tax=Nonomuraea glycinis TaxID=2047744 RepID=UPI00166DDFC3|nr:CopG family transcriptional regulator [Nonomuraea glycinis]MCA2175510.1 ribbon-helix-helix domain-containing protein [Nonomuraea glycinis]